MKGVPCLLLLAASLAAQSGANDPANASAVRALSSTLLTLKDGASRFSISQQLASELTSAADSDHRPPQKSLRQFADKLVNSLSSTNLRSAPLSELTASIVAVLHSAGTSTIGFHETVERAEKTLIAMGVARSEARSLADALRSIGNQVRGPDDSPVSSPFAFRPKK